MSQITDSNNSFVPVTANTSTKPSATAPTQALSDEVMTQIFNLLSAQELAACSSVCRQWCGLSKDRFLWKDLFMSRFPTCNHLGIDDFQKAYQLLCSNFANGVYASHTLTGHRRHGRTGVNCIAVIDGKLVSGATDHTIKVWDPETNRCLYTLTGHSSVTCFAVIDGKIVSGCDDGKIRVWDLEKRKRVHTLTGHTGGVYCLAVIDGKLVSGSDDNTIRVWDFKAKNDAVFEEIAGLFQSNVPTAMDRFSRMPAKEKNKVYGELYEILKPLSNDYFGCAEHAFHDQHGLTSTPQQKALAIRHYLLRKTAQLFEGDEHDRKAAMEGFMWLPIELREKIYGELYGILKPFSNDYYGCAEHAFHDQYGQSSTPVQKAEAIHNYLSRGSE